MVQDNTQADARAQGSATGSPLAEPAPCDLDAVWDRDPHAMTDAEIDALIAALRAQRARWHEKEVARERKREEREDAAEEEGEA